MIYLKRLFLIPIFLTCAAVSLAVTFNKSEVNKVTTLATTQKAVPVIVIDPGHGGFDGGASSSDGTPEKDINLNISLYLRDCLKCCGFNTVLTRDTDISLESDPSAPLRTRKTSDIHNRFDIMKNADNSVFVSIHQNHYSVEKYSGAQVFYSPGNSEHSSLLAQCIQGSIISDVQPNNTRLIKECGTSVYLIYNAVRPAVLVECGFLSNNAESERLKSTNYQKKLARAIARGIINYYKLRKDA